MTPVQRSPCIGCRREHKSKKHCSTRCPERIKFMDSVEFWGERLGECPAHNVGGFRISGCRLPLSDESPSGWFLI
jgi:hypothetical protein